uniref:Putative mitogen-activated protein kin n=1 Tax=Corethrella appendiculata TaxID=1370023 RepID=U5EXG3_9DIPT
MTDDVKKFFHSILQKVVGLHCIFVTDRDGVPLVKIIDKASDVAMKPAFLSTFTLATDQASKLGLGKNKNIITIYADYQVLQMNKLPLVVTFIGTENCNIGHILSLDLQIETMLDELKLAVTDS